MCKVGKNNNKHFEPLTQHTNRMCKDEKNNNKRKTESKNSLATQMKNSHKVNEQAHTCQNA